MIALFGRFETIVLGLAGASGMAIAMSATTLPAQISRAGTGVSDTVTSLLQKRSPGVRTRGELVKTKSASSRRSASGAARSKPVVALAPDALQDAAAPLSQSAETALYFAAPMLGNPVGTGGLVEPAVFTPTGGSIFSTAGFVPNLGGGGGGGSGGGGGGGGGGTETPPTPAAPIPEPATWAMMLTGFAMLGASLRRRRWMTVARVAAASHRPLG